MALKDLVASKASLAEDVIEQIVSDYIRFDSDDKEVAFTPAANELSSKARILVYLVALQGWPFVLDEVVPVDAKPAEIERHTGISGGTLRPLLKELKDRNIITEKGGRYSVRAVALHTIQRELNGDGGPSSTRARKKSRRSASAAPDASMEETNSGSDAKKKARSSSTSGAGERFQSWIDEGFFDKPRTLSDVQQRFHKEAIIIPQTSLPGYLLKSVRSGQLSRDKEEVNGKTVWVYRRVKK
ncbi:MAG: hypothetical protein ABL904_20145 [Hyphomicrobiaceae bacterium]